jgi:CBS-domain-containing membrane protein
MTQDVKFCYDDEDVDHVARNMGDQQVRRLPVVNRAKRLVGILALATLPHWARRGRRRRHSKAYRSRAEALQICTHWSRRPSDRRLPFLSVHPTYRD